MGNVKNTKTHVRKIKMLTSYTFHVIIRQVAIRKKNASLC